MARPFLGESGKHNMVQFVVDDETNRKINEECEKGHRERSNFCRHVLLCYFKNREMNGNGALPVDLLPKSLLEKIVIESIKSDSVFGRAIVAAVKKAGVK